MGIGSGVLLQEKETKWVEALLASVVSGEQLLSEQTRCQTPSYPRIEETHCGMTGETSSACKRTLGVECAFLQVLRTRRSRLGTF